MHLKIVDGRKNKENNIVKGYIGRLVIDILMHLVLERTVVREVEEKRRERDIIEDWCICTNFIDYIF